MRSNRSPARVLLAAASLFIAMLITGCASVPTPEQMRADVSGYQLPNAPAPGQALVYVVRPARLGGVIRFNVFVDDQEEASEVGFTRARQYIHFALAPGRHKIFSKADNWAEIELTVQAGEVVFIEQQPGIGFLLARNNLERVDEVVGRYHVKHLELGTLHNKRK
jgi:hypothetical protein